MVNIFSVVGQHMLCPYCNYFPITFHLATYYKEFPLATFVNGMFDKIIVLA